MRRRTHHPNRPSRFQVAFACPTPDDAKLFRSEFQRSEASIRQVSAARASIHDLRFLTFETIDEYWSGKATPSPLFEALLAPPVLVGPLIDGPGI